MSSLITLCELCRRQIAGTATENVETSPLSSQCVLCFGILDSDFKKEVAFRVGETLKTFPCDASSFILALNLPTSQTLRETVLMKSRPDFDGILAKVPFKIRCIDAYISELSKASGLRPTLHSDLQLTITFVQTEFNDYDFGFLSEKFPGDFAITKKQKLSGNIPTEVSKEKLQQISGRITTELAQKFELKTPSSECSYSIGFERDPIYIGGRYCKFSRSLPQSPWSPEEKDAPKKPGNSVSEKICNILKREFGASSSTFIASGREDIDVRMLGEGRPFVVELKHCRFTKELKGQKYLETLKSVEKMINGQTDIKVNYLTRVTKEQSEQLTVGQEEKRKCYSAYCYSTLPLDDDAFARAEKQIPVETIQKTPVRVLKRRTLLDRPRTIYTLKFIRFDEHHFLARLETQAGTYIKEFVHGDFGRTRPSLADLLGVENGEVDILELDVEKVEQEWPPTLSEPATFS